MINVTPISIAAAAQSYAAELTKNSVSRIA